MASVNLSLWCAGVTLKASFCPKWYSYLSQQCRGSEKDRKVDIGGDGAVFQILAELVFPCPAPILPTMEVYSPSLYSITKCARKSKFSPHTRQIYSYESILVLSSSDSMPSCLYAARFPGSEVTWDLEKVLHVNKRARCLISWGLIWIHWSIFALCEAKFLIFERI